MRIYPHLIICEHCDSVYRRQELNRDEVARCRRCDAVLYRADRLGLEQWLALVIAAAAVCMMANVFPVIRISFQGLSNEVTLWQSMLALAHSEVAPIAVPAILSVIVVPAMQIGLLLWVLLFAVTGQQAPLFQPVMKVLLALRPWSMVDVCLLGILVSVTKLSGYLDVTPGRGLWATGALTLLIIVITNRDFNRLWQLTDRWVVDEAGG